KYPKLAVISNCGYPEQTHFQVLSLLFARLARNMHSEVIAEIYRAAGPLFEIKMPIVEPLLGEYKQLLRRAGREVVEHGRLSDATRVELDKPLVPADVYREQSNQGWDRALARIGGA
ncbi:MAG: flavodoxin family protein, partial [Armatimonadota bacterium]